MNIKINEQSYKIVEDYLSKINKPEQNFISNNIVLTFIIGIHDRIRFIVQEYLTDKNTNNEIGYKNQIISNCEVFWNFLNANMDRLPILRSEFVKNIIIKLFNLNRLFLNYIYKIITIIK